MKAVRKMIRENLKKILLVSALSVTAPTFTAVSAVELITNPMIEDSVIRLGDLFIDSGELADTIVMEAPEAGSRKTITIYELSTIAEQNNLDWEAPNYLKRIYIERAGVPFVIKDIEPMLLNAAKDNGVTNNVEVSVFGKKGTLYLPVGFSLDDIEIREFILSNDGNRFSASLDVPSGGMLPNEISLNGTLHQVQFIPVFNRVITPGEVITKEDIRWEKYPVRRLNRNILTPTCRTFWICTTRESTRWCTLKILRT